MDQGSTVQDTIDPLCNSTLQQGTAKSEMERARGHIIDILGDLTGLRERAIRSRCRRASAGDRPEVININWLVVAAVVKMLTDGRITGSRA
jgi:hypothetical protein